MGEGQDECDGAVHQLYLYLDGELTAHSWSRMERHVRECVECRRLVAGLSQVMDGLHRLPLPEGAGRAVQIAASVLSRLRKSAP